MKTGEKGGLWTGEKTRKGQEGKGKVMGGRVSFSWPVGSTAFGAGCPGLELLTPGMLLKLPELSLNLSEHRKGVPRAWS